MTISSKRSGRLTGEKRQQCLKDIEYRVNCLMSWDLFVYIKGKYLNENSVYNSGQLVEPAFEASIIFGRHLLQFLKIKSNRKNDKLIIYNPNNDTQDDDLTISDLYGSDNKNPLNDLLTQNNEKLLLDLIKVANKSIAHFTSTPATSEELDNIMAARFIIYELLLKYIPDINKTNIRWEHRNEYCDALYKW